jgi:hypothetical protein
MFRKLALGVLFLSSLALTACGDDSPTAPGDSAPSNTGFTGPYSLSNWENTGITDGTTNVGPGDNPKQHASFGYDVNLGDRTGLGISDRYVTFHTEAAASGTVTIEWEYTGYHAFYQTRAHLEFHAARSGEDDVKVSEVSGPAGGGFSFSGSTSFEVEEGEDFGFTLGGGHFDRDGRLRGTLTINRLVAPR